jgi:hypothetical protein
MIKSVSIIYFILFSGILVSPASAAQGTFEYCQDVGDKIRYYTKLRKSGGSAKTMERWKDWRNHYKAQFSELNCKKWQKGKR